MHISFSFNIKRTIPLNINKYKNPSKSKEKKFKSKRIYKTKELEETYLTINVYELIDDINPNISNKFIILQEEYKRKSKFNSDFNINLLSFLFKSKR